MNDYSRIALVIEHLERNRACHPKLNDLAVGLDLDQAQLDQLLRRWAGVTPEEILGFLTVENTRKRLSHSNPASAGIPAKNGPKMERSPTPAVLFEVATAAEIRDGGAALHIQWGHGNSCFGPVSVGWTNRGIAHLAFHPQTPDALPQDLAYLWPHAERVENPKQAVKIINRVFNPAKTSPPLSVFVKASPFQLRVWTALSKIPPGEIVSYQEIAADLGNPGAARAVGTACGANPIAYLVPCHRVVGQTGMVRGYRWGTIRKRAILAREEAIAHLALQRIGEI